MWFYPLVTDMISLTRSQIIVCDMTLVTLRYKPYFKPSCGHLHLCIGYKTVSS